jgi:hypothetical protein
VTEAEWLACGVPLAMLEFLRGKASDRKSRLLAVACCHRIWHLIPVYEASQCVNLAELYADGKASREQLDHAIQLSMNRCDYTRSWWGARWGVVEIYAIQAVTRVHRHDEGSRARTLPYAAQAWAYAELMKWQRTGTGDEQNLRAVVVEETARQAGLVRCIFGNPFYPATADPVWFTSTVVSLAQGIYEERAFDRLPILADALQDAGCENDDILDHCRTEGPHVRGCWVVDLLTGRA